MVYCNWHSSLFGFVHRLVLKIKLTQHFSGTGLISDLRSNNEVSSPFGQVGEALLTLWSQPQVSDTLRSQISAAACSWRESDGGKASDTLGPTGIYALNF
jgi:hypothetical protein